MGTETKGFLYICDSPNKLATIARVANEVKRETAALLGPSTALDPRDIEAIRRRLVAIRKAETGDNQSAFARKLGITVPRWHNLENGYPVSIGIVMALKRSIKGMTSFYILEGKTDSMPDDLVRRLAEFDRELLRQLPKSGGASKSDGASRSSPSM